MLGAQRAAPHVRKPPLSGVNICLHPLHGVHTRPHREILLFKAAEIIDADTEVAARNLRCQMKVWCLVVNSVYMKSTRVDLFWIVSI